MARRRALEAALSGIALAALVGCKENKAPAPWTVTQPTSAGRNYKLTVAGAAQCQVRSNTEKPTSGNITLGFDVILESTGNERVGIHPMGIQVVDGQGMRYKAFFDGGCQPELDNHRYIGKNEKHRGWFSVNVPEATEKLTVVVQSEIVGSSDRDEVRFEAQRGTR